MSPDLSPPSVLETGQYSEFLLHTPAEVAVVLRGLLDHIAQITVFFNEGQDMLLTSLAHVGEDHLILDFGSASEMNRKALEAKKHFCVTTLDKVRVQFILREFSRTEHEGRPAFRCALPEDVLRLQRREFYRLVTPLARPLICRIPLPLEDGRDHIHMANVFDISVGGLGLAAPPDTYRFGPEMSFAGIRLELPEIGTVSGALQVRSVYEVVLRSGARVRRAGCEFVKLPGTQATLIQRYIIKVERERKARESGLG